MTSRVTCYLLVGLMLSERLSDARPEPRGPVCLGGGTHFPWGSIMFRAHFNDIPEQSGL